jgi:hypothetical protein
MLLRESYFIDKLMMLPPDIEDAIIQLWTVAIQSWKAVSFCIEELT